MDVTIVTAMFGGCDVIRTQAPQDIEVDWIAVTDGPRAPDPWRTVFRRSSGSPNLAAKRFKLTPAFSTRHTIWIDANMQITASGFAREAIACIHDGLATWKHPRRDCVYEEAEASLTYESQNGKYDDQPIREQIAQYRLERFPEHAGLYACGTIAWDTEDSRAQRLGMEWRHECEVWSNQDQLSLPVVAHRIGIEPGVFSHPQITQHRPVLANPWLQIHDHL